MSWCDTSVSARDWLLWISHSGVARPASSNRPRQLSTTSNRQSRTYRSMVAAAFFPSHLTRRNDELSTCFCPANSSAGTGPVRGSGQFDTGVAQCPTVGVSTWPNRAAQPHLSSPLQQRLSIGKSMLSALSDGITTFRGFAGSVSFSGGKLLAIVLGLCLFVLTLTLHSLHQSFGSPRLCF